jgi:MFS transporter, DHA1 family, multidrug resistance protein
MKNLANRIFSSGIFGLLDARLLLILMTALAVISDAVLMPFYPLFFEERFSIVDSKVVGIYMSAFCVVVMLTFPLWVKASKKINEIPLLLVGQLSATVLAIVCVYTTSLIAFWVFSLLMFACKASYLLIYPLIMRLDTKVSQEKTIGVLSVIVHLGFILGALIGGMLLSHQDAHTIYWSIAIADFIQFILCLIVFIKFYPLATIDAPVTLENQTKPANFLLKIGSLMAIFYFGASVASPFFVSYWLNLSELNHPAIAGIIYAIPGLVALVILGYVKTKSYNWMQNLQSLVVLLALGIVGWLIQTHENETSIILGRILLGISLYYGVVRLDLVIFQVSKPEDYGSAFSGIYIFQNIGAIAAFYAAGFLVRDEQWYWPFVVAAIAFFTCLLLIRIILRKGTTQQDDIETIAIQPEQPRS